ncbi:MAG: hypothetical protein ACK4UN_04155 [Limisphaerales bacterium]
MKTSLKLITGMFVGILVASAQGATLLVNDNYNVTGSGSGFALTKGANSGINPPTTRLTGSLSPGLRYIHTGTKDTNSYTITGNKLKVVSAANAGRFTLSANGTTPFDFGPAVGSDVATAAHPSVYELSLSMDNDSTGTLGCRSIVLRAAIIFTPSEKGSTPVHRDWAQI